MFIAAVHVSVEYSRPRGASPLLLRVEPISGQHFQYSHSYVAKQSHGHLRNSHDIRV